MVSQHSLRAPHGPLARGAEDALLSSGEAPRIPPHAKASVRFWDDAHGHATPAGILSPVTPPPVMDLFEGTGAYLRGHFRLTSGLHSPEYLQCAKVLAIPSYAERLGRELAETLGPSLGGYKVDMVVSPAMGGIIIGHEVARALNVSSFFAERDAVSNEMTLRRGFVVEPGQKAVVIEDVVTTGGSTKEVVRLLQSLGVEVVAAGSIIDRSGGCADVGVPRVALQVLHPVTYDPTECPLCRDGMPVVKPGSRRT